MFLVKTSLMALFLAAVSLGLLAGYRWVTTTEHFAVDKVEVRGNRVLSDGDLRKMAGVARGMNIFAVNLGGVQRRLSRSGWIDSVLVRRSLPDTLLLQVDERQPVFWIKRGETIYFADEEGRAIAPVRAGNFLSLPFLLFRKGGGHPEDKLGILRSRLRDRSLPFTLAQLAWIRFYSGEIVEMHLMDRSLRLCLGGSALRKNLGSLAAVWRDLRERKELDRARRILVYQGRAWVKLAPAEGQ